MLLCVLYHDDPLPNRVIINRKELYDFYYTAITLTILLMQFHPHPPHTASASNQMDGSEEESGGESGAEVVVIKPLTVVSQVPEVSEW